MKPATPAIELINSERARQIMKGFDAAHDDQHTDGSILEAAVSIANLDCPRIDIVDLNTDNPSAVWPQVLAHRVFRKYKGSDIQRLVIAASMIAAEIDRLMRK